MRRIFAALVGLIGSAGLAAAQTPVAVVEDVSGPVTGAEFMDYVAPGKVIKLGPAGTITLGYMKSCRRETITGIGTVIIGKEESMVHLGEVKAGRTDCDSGHAQVVKRETGESAAMVVRSYRAKEEVAPQFTLYGLSPVFETPGRGKLLVERLDVQGERYEVDLAAAPMLRGKFYDFARIGTALTPGGTYAASLGARKAVFLVDPRAAPGAGPIIGRLVRIE